MADLSGQMHGASLAPEGESSAGPWAAAHSYPSSEDEVELSPPASQATAGRCAPETLLTDHALYPAMSKVWEPGWRPVSAICTLTPCEICM